MTPEHIAAAAAFSPTDHNMLLEAALHAASQGLHVFPMRPCSKIPAFKQWEDRATTDAATLRRWWARAPYNPGIACGPSGIVGIDLDSARGPLPAPWASLGITHGRDTIRVLARRAGQPVPYTTRTIITPNNNEHWLFKAPADRKLRNRVGASGHGLGPLIDVRAHGGALAAAGAVLLVDDTLRRYREHPERPHELAPLPQWVVDLLTPPPPVMREPITLPAQGRRLDAYIDAALSSATEAVADAPVGERADTLFREAAALGELVGCGAVAEDAVREVLHAAARRHDGVSDWTFQEADGHIRNGIDRGKANPRSITFLAD